MTTIIAATTTLLSLRIAYELIHYNRCIYPRRGIKLAFWFKRYIKMFQRKFMKPYMNNIYMFDNNIC